MSHGAKPPPREPEYFGDIVGSLTAADIDFSDDWIAAHGTKLVAALPVRARLDRCPYCGAIVTVHILDAPGVLLLWDCFPSINFAGIPCLSMHLFSSKADSQRSRATPVERKNALSSACRRVLDRIARGERDGLHGDGCGHFGEGGVLGGPGEGGGKS